jgi:hypothetical protein
MPQPILCPSCGAEYVWTATTCSDCGISLVAGGAAPQRDEQELPPVAELVCVRAAALGWARALSERLADAGIPSRIEVAREQDDDGSVRRPGANLPFGVYVLPADAEAAAEVDADFVREQLPDLSEHGGIAEGDDPDRCPACGASAAGAAECPDCGLALG